MGTIEERGSELNLFLECRLWLAFMLLCVIWSGSNVCDYSDETSPRAGGCYAHGICVDEAKNGSHMRVAAAGVG